MQLECFYKNAFSGVQWVKGIDKTNNRTCTWQGRVILTLMPDPYNTHASTKTNTHTHARAHDVVDPF